MEPQKSVTFDFQLFPINNTTSRRSWNLIIMTLGDTFTNATHITNTTLNHLYLNTLCLSSYINWLKDLNVCARVYGLRLISSMSLDSTKDIQPVKSVKSICIHSLKPATYPLLRGIIRGVKQPLKCKCFSCSFPLVPLSFIKLGH